MVVEFVIGDLLVDIGVVAFPDDRDLLAMRLQMPVDAVVGDIGQAVLEPLDRDLALEGRVLDLGIGLEPVDPLAMLAQNLSGVSTLSSYHFRYLSLSISARVLADFNTG